MSTEIGQLHEDLLSAYKMEFQDNYSPFEVKLVVDVDIPDNYGERFQPVCLVVSDSEADITMTVLIESSYRCQFDVYDGVLEKLDAPSDLWKFLYFAARRSARRGE